jgi:hypothetical protein
VKKILPHRCPRPSIGDSGVFSEEDAEIDFTEIKKPSRRLTGHLPLKAAFSQLRQLQLSGEAEPANVAVFLKHLTNALTQLDLVIEDPESGPALGLFQ